MDNDDILEKDISISSASSLENQFNKNLQQRNKYGSSANQ